MTPHSPESQKQTRTRTRRAPGEAPSLRTEQWVCPTQKGCRGLLFSLSCIHMPQAPNIPPVAAASVGAPWHLSPCGLSAFLSECRRRDPQRLGQASSALIPSVFPAWGPRQDPLAEVCGTAGSTKPRLSGHRTIRGASENQKDSGLQRGRRVGDFWAHSQAVHTWVPS